MDQDFQKPSPLLIDQAAKRPVITEYQDPVLFFSDMIAYRKQTERSFSVLNQCKYLRKVSPTLVTLIQNRKRKITLDRVDEYSKLLKLTWNEKIHFRDWIESLEGRKFPSPAIKNPNSKKNVSVSILNDWLNIYVKDCFQIPRIQNQPELIFKELGAIASQKRVQRSLNYLLEKGYLVRTPDGKIKVETALTIAEPPTPHQKIREFHRSALQIAKNAIEIFHPTERFANTLIVPLTKQSYDELVQLVHKFAENLKEFASHQQSGDRLYQVTINLSPTGGKVDQ